MAKRVSKGKGDSETPVRTTFTTSRLLDFFFVKELTAQIGHAKSDDTSFDLFRTEELDGVL